MNTIKKLLSNKLISYVFVGGIATIVEWICFYIFSEKMGMFYQLGTVLAMLISTFANWLVGRLWTFRDAAKGNIILEIGKIYATSAIGILLNMLLMWIFVSKMSIEQMIAKILATIIVFAYNYLVRRLVIYRKKAEPRDQGKQAEESQNKEN